MAYQAKRRKTFKEEFQLVDEEGKVAKTLYVNLEPMAVAEKLSEKYLNLQKSLEEVKKAKETKENMHMVVGMAMKEILETIFGTEDTATIIEFYSGRYIEMCREILPFVGNVVVPKVRKMAQEERKEIVAGYNRKQRRLLKKKGF